MSSAHVPRNRSVASSSKSRGMVAAAAANNSQQDFGMVASPLMRYFEPCAATAGMFLYAQGNSVVCCHHDTLTIERRFSRHSDEIQLLAVDSQSERGAGRLVVSYDAGQTAIVWDIMSGEEVARFASYEHLTTAAWMRNGNVAFGNTQGNIILFEPETSEHLSTRTLDQIAVTALAPAADCRTFAIGYQNGSLLICNLQPRFTILHNLTTNRAPSPVVNLAWHASSSRQKSDMLATQTNDGDLRVWSVSKAYNSADPAKVVRILKRTENFIHGPNWMGWSKNGRIIQFSEGDTLSWDVRTKHVTNDSIPTLEHVRGLAVYGPGANLFTLGANNTVQQFDLNAPAMMTANVQHPANLLPPSPPVSIEEQKAAAAAASDSEISIHIESNVSESEEDRMSPLARMRHQADLNNARANVNISEGESLDRYGMGSPASSRSQASSISSASSRTPAGYQQSIQSRGMTENTYISAGSSLASGAQPPRRRHGDDGYSIASSLSSVSMTSSHNRQRNRPSRLRNEVAMSPMSPEESKVRDLFKFTRSRLSDVPYKRPPPIDHSQLTNDDLRRQMLSTIFGWTRDIRDLVRDEMARHPQGSPNRILLAKWLGDIDQDIMATSSENMTSSDWMLLALSGIGSVASQHKLGRAYVQRLLESGDLHAAATIMIGMGDHNDAIEIYVSHKKHLEALILTCLFFPAVWERQSQIIKKWGEWAVQHGQQQLAIRCFSCTDKESTEPWTSPSATQLTFQSMTPASIPEVLSPPLSPPGVQRGPQRSIAKTSALKLITSFGDQSSKSKFFSGQDGGKTPLAGGVTPIAESAISPGGNGDMTAFLRPSQRSQFNTPASARPHAGARNRLPSIGEMTADGTPRDRLTNAALPTPPVDRTEHSRNNSGSSHGAGPAVEQYSTGLGIPRASTASPMMMREHKKKREPPPPSPGPASMAMLMEGRTSRNGPRQRIPDGVDLHLEPLDQVAASDITSPEQSVASSTRFHWPSRRRGPASVASSVTSASTSRSHRGRHNVEGRTLDDYIHSLDAVKSKSRGNSRDGRGRAAEPRSHHRLTSRERSGDRGRTASRGYTPKAGKRSPRSPVPMSPEELINLSTPRMHDLLPGEEGPDPATARKSSQVRQPKSRGASRVSTRSVRRVSPDRRMTPAPLDISRAQGDDRGQPATKSPSSPIPMSASVAHFNNSEDEEDYYRAIEQQQKFRNTRSRTNNRSTSRGPRAGSPDGSAYRERSRSRRRPSVGINTKDRDSPENRARTPGLSVPAGGVGEVRYSRDERARKKEQAARELEERRRSLARQPQAPAIPHPDALSPVSTRAPVDAFQLPSTTFQHQPARDIRDLPPRSKTTEPSSSSSRSMYANRPGIGLPATPKAMRLVMDGDSLKGVPSVPAIPQGFGQQQSGQSQRRSPPLSGSPSPKSNGSPKRLEPAAPAPAPVDPATVAGGPPSLLTLLPSTVYSPPVRPPIARCMSAPPEEPVAPRVLQGGASGHQARASVSSRAHPGARKLSHPDVLQDQSGMRTIDSLIDSEPPASFARRASNDDRIPPPPPPAPAPPMLKELAHLAMPPPPPPAPLPFNHTAKPTVYGSPAAIEIVMEDGRTQPLPTSPPMVLPMSEATVPVLAAPAPPSSRTSFQPQHRTRTSIDSSASGGIGSRFARATERIRSASRSRQQTQTQQQDNGAYAPYESVPPPPPPVPAFAARGDIASPVQTRAPADAFTTGLLQSEMI